MFGLDSVVFSSFLLSVPSLVYIERCRNSDGAGKKDAAPRGRRKVPRAEKSIELPGVRVSVLIARAISRAWRSLQIFRTFRHRTFVDFVQIRTCRKQAKKSCTFGCHANSPRHPKKATKTVSGLVLLPIGEKPFSNFDKYILSEFRTKSNERFSRSSSLFTLKIQEVLD